MVRVFIKMIMCEIMARVIVSVIRHVKLTNVLILKFAHARNVLLAY